MKKVRLLTLLSFFVLGAANESMAQENVFKINIFSPLVKTFNASFERKLSPNSSFQLGFFYTGIKVSETKFSGFGITPEYRFYLSEAEAPKGVYLAPFVRYQNFKLTKESSNSSGTLALLGGGVVIGHQWIFKERISLDIFLGPQFSGGDVEVTNGTDSFDTKAFSGFGIRTGLTLGIAF